MGRQDFETETLIAHSLSADGFDASEDGTGRGTPMVPVAICTAHTKSNGSGFSEDVAHTLESGGGAQAVAFPNLRGREVRLRCRRRQDSRQRSRRSRGQTANSYVAFSAKDYGADADDIAPTLRSMGHDASHANGGGQVAIAFTHNQRGEVLSARCDAARVAANQVHAIASGRNDRATVAFTLHGSDGTASAASATDIAGSLRTRAPGSIENSSTTAVLQEQSVASQTHCLLRT